MSAGGIAAPAREPSMSTLILFWGLAACSEFELVSTEDDARDEVGILKVDPGLLDFGVIPDGEVAADQVVTLTSIGALPVELSAIAVEGSGAFTLTGVEEGLVLDPGESTELIVSFVPDLQRDEGELVVESDAAEPLQTVQLTGARSYAWLELSPTELALHSELGEQVTGEVLVTSVGTADLELSGMILQEDAFTAEGELPITLAPGQSTTLTVTYRPETPGETVEGRIWLGTNTEAGQAVVPLVGTQDPGCIGLGEAWDRGDLSAKVNRGGSLVVESGSADLTICIDRWYVWLSEDSQDLGAGDMNGDDGDIYPLGSLEISESESLSFEAAATGGPAWYCMEETQRTRSGSSYEFIGARVPEPMLTYMRNGDQESSWDWQSSNPVMIAGRRTNLVKMSTAGGVETVGFRVINMGAQEGTVEARETVPDGYSASDFSSPPSRTEAGEDGSTVYIFAFSLEGREETDLYTDTIYDEIEISYKLEVPECAGRAVLPPMETRWYDAEDIQRSATANPMVLVCE